MNHFIDLLPGIIWSGFLGLAIGNFATNPIYRLPRGEALFARDPYCGDCNAPLKPRDLFPVFSWLATRGKCRYCGAGVPGAYALTEALAGLLFITFYLKYGFSDQFILCSFGTVALLMLAMMIYIDGFFSDRTLAACLMLGMLHRVLADGSINGFMATGYAGLIIGVVTWKMSGKPTSRDFAAFPAYLKLLAVAGVWLNWLQLGFLLMAVLPVSVLRLRKKWLLEWVIIADVIISVTFA